MQNFGVFEIRDLGILPKVPGPRSYLDFVKNKFETPLIASSTPSQSRRVAVRVHVPVAIESVRFLAFLIYTHFYKYPFPPRSNTQIDLFGPS